MQGNRYPSHNMLSSSLEADIEFKFEYNNTDEDIPYEDQVVRGLGLKLSEYTPIVDFQLYF